MQQIKKQNAPILKAKNASNLGRKGKRKEITKAKERTCKLQKCSHKKARKQAEKMHEHAEIGKPEAKPTNCKNTSI